MNFSFGTPTTTAAGSTFGTTPSTGGFTFGSGDAKPLFGGASTDNKAFNFASPTTSASAFGGFSFGAKTTAATSSAFLTPTTAATPAFGASKPLAFGGFTSPPNQTVGSPGFGQPATQNAANLSFGAPKQPAPAFGTPTLQTSMVSNSGTEGKNLFGSPQLQPTGTTSTAPQTSQSGFSFGSTTTTSNVGSAASTGFGANKLGTPQGFGQPTSFGAAQVSTPLNFNALSTPTSAISFGQTAQTALTNALSSQPAQSQPSALNFSTPTTQTAQPALNFTPTTTGISFGTTTSALSFGTSTATTSLSTPTTKSGLNFSTPSYVPTTGLNFSAASTQPTSLSFGTTTATSGISFGTTTATSGISFGTTTATSGISFGTTTTTTSAPGISFAPASTAAPTTQTSTSLGFFKPTIATAASSAAPSTTASGITALGKSTATTTMPSLTTAAITSAPLTQPTPISSLTFTQLEENINKWTLDLEEQEKIFINQATQINAWDRLLISNGEKILELNDAVTNVKNEQQSLEHELEFVQAQQKELEDLLSPMEKQLLEDNTDRMRDPEREHMYSLAENLDTQLKQMSEDLKEVIEHLNETNRSQDSNDPIVQIGRILNAHMSSMQWIDNSISQISTKLDHLKATHDTLRRDNERSFQLTYN